VWIIGVRSSVLESRDKFGKEIGLQFLHGLELVVARRDVGLMDGLDGFDEEHVFDGSLVEGGHVCGDGFGEFEHCACGEEVRLYVQNEGFDELLLDLSVNSLGDLSDVFEFLAGVLRLIDGFDAASELPVDGQGTAELIFALRMAELLRLGLRGDVRLTKEGGEGGEILLRDGIPAR